jgi:hypothetical protein
LGVETFIAGRIVDFMPKTNWEQTDGRVVKVESIYPKGRRQFIVTFSYEVQGHRYEGKLGTFKSMNVGISDKCRIPSLDCSRLKRPFQE